MPHKVIRSDCVCVWISYPDKPCDKFALVNKQYIRLTEDSMIYSYFYHFSPLSVTRRMHGCVLCPEPTGRTGVRYAHKMSRLRSYAH